MVLRLSWAHFAVEHDGHLSHELSSRMLTRMPPSVFRPFVGLQSRVDFQTVCASALVSLALLNTIPRPDCQEVESPFNELLDS